MQINKLSLSALTLVALTFGLSGSSLAKQDEVPNGNLVSQIDYQFVGHLGQLNENGRLLVWEATIAGDFSGEMKWWFDVTPPVSNSPFSFYSGRWEIWIDNELVLAGESAGKTVFADGVVPGGSDGVWDGHGVVTEAHGKYNPLKGRKIYETGPVMIGDGPPVTFSGTGMFMVY